jgi:hypothetical protein
VNCPSGPIDLTGALWQFCRKEPALQTIFGRVPHLNAAGSRACVEFQGITSGASAATVQRGATRLVEWISSVQFATVGQAHEQITGQYYSCSYSRS